MKSTAILAALALTFTVAAACTAANDEVDGAVTEAQAMAARAQAAPPGEADVTRVQQGSATGMITALDPATSTITIDHGPVAELQWPAMNMGFGATPAQLAQLHVGQRVEFDFKMAGSQATTIRIAPTQ